jgi:RNA polymerase sigma factor (sigma-70 family)
MTSPVDRAGSATPTDQRFTTTHWSVVILAGQSESGASRGALEILCRQYWPPVYTFIRQRGYGIEDAQDLTQEFFTRLLERNYVESADASRGKFRTYLLTAVTRFLINERERTQAQKRGGGHFHFSLDCTDTEERRYLEPATDVTIFERRWAETMLETVLARLRQEYEKAAEIERFERLKPFLTSEKPAGAATELASRLGITESAAYSAVHRFRRRYGELLREEIAQTVSSPEEIEEELRYLVRALSG